ncbi:MAG: dienelactone hydrolase family protein [Deltaproteobacteria bacterium]|nr:dienelactone hydrolase family protein [Deltaproteobacteria bacterium]
MQTNSSTVQIATPDGNMTGHLARPADGGRYPAALVIMEAFGLNAHIKGVADRIAAKGFVTLAPDIYHRQANAVVGYDQLPEAIRLMTSVTDAQIIADVSAAVATLQSDPGVDGARIGITGFCMGGRISFLSACNVPAIRAAAPFYGGGIGGLLDQAHKIACPLLLFFGDQDPFIPNEEVAKITQTLADLKKDATVKVYPGAPHGFFCDERDSYRPDAARDAWDELGKFFTKHLMP